MSSLELSEWIQREFHQRISHVDLYIVCLENYKLDGPKSNWKTSAWNYLQRERNDLESFPMKCSHHNLIFLDKVGFGNSDKLKLNMERKLSIVANSQGKQIISSMLSSNWWNPRHVFNRRDIRLLKFSCWKVKYDHILVKTLYGF